MSEVNTFACDICHKQKGIETSWWVVFLNATKDAVLIQPFSAVKMIDRTSTIAKLKDACGIECALKLAAGEIQQLQN